MNEITLPDEPEIPTCAACGHCRVDHQDGQGYCSECECTAFVGPASEVVPYTPPPAEIQHRAQNPLDMDPIQFQAALDRRRTNRDALLNWIRSQLKKGVDFGPIHVVSRAKCDKGKWCDNPNHFSKPSLFKPGAEKIVGILGLSPRFPTLEQYEAACIAGTTINQIILRCELVDTSGRVVGSGIGARFTAQDNGDLNKSLKMAKKSAYIDATITGAGLSEEYTLDVEDMNHDVDEGGGGGELFPETKPAAPAAPQPPKPTGELCPCGSPIIEAKTGAKAKKPNKPYLTCELSHRAFKGEESANSLLEKWDAENPNTKHTWRWK